MALFFKKKQTLFFLALSLICQTILAADPSPPPLTFNLNEIQPTQQFVTADNTFTGPDAVLEHDTNATPESQQTINERQNAPLGAITKKAPATPTVHLPNNLSDLVIAPPAATPLGMNAQDAVVQNPLIGGLNIPDLSLCKTLGSRQCQNTQDPNQYRTCLIQHLQQSNCKAFVAFATAASMSARDDIDYIKHYKELDLIHVVRYGANYPGVYYALGMDGALVDLVFGRQTQVLDIRTDPHYSEIAERYPNAMLFSIVDKLPQVEQPGPDGSGIRLILRFQLLNGCHACERAGYAYVAYDFSDTGALMNTSIESLQP